MAITLKQFVMSKTQLATHTQDEHVLQYIPKNIFQTFQSAELAKSPYQAIQSWRSLNPTWSHYFFTDEDQRTFIADHFPSEVLWAYDQLLPGAYRADLWRYCVLYSKGGIYVDHKLVLHIPLDTAIPIDCEFATYQDQAVQRYQNKPYEFYLWQGIMISKQKHPFLKKAIDNIVANVTLGNYGHDPLSITGPGLLGQSINECLGRPFDAPFNLGSHQIRGYHFYVMPKPFQSNKRRVIASLFHHESAVQMYPSYYREYQFTSLCPDKLDYASAWFFSKVYQHGQCFRSPNDQHYTRKVKRFYRRKIKLAYRLGQYAYGRRLLLETLNRQALQPRVWWLWLKYKIFKKI
jgi:hypothetical protein